MPINIEHVKRHIDGNLKEIRRIEEIARQLGVSHETLRKEFMRQEGRSLHCYVEEKRVTLARHLLADTDLRCFEICFAVGYHREDTGAKAFKRLMGMTMEEHRLLSRDGKSKNHK